MALEIILRIAVCTTIFPLVMPYWTDFILSLQNQSFVADLVVVNDGVKGEIPGLSTYPGHVSVVQGGGTTSENRGILIAAALEKDYDWAVFGDADDFFEANRIETVLNKSRSVDCLVNDLALVDAIGRILRNSLWGTRISNSQVIGLDFLRDSNIAGLSNSAVKTSFLRNLALPPMIQAVDWYLFSLVAARGAKIEFCSTTKSFYRQYGANFAGAIDNQSPSKVMNAIRVKAAHYKALMTSVAGFEGRALYFDKLERAVTGDSDLFDAYMNRIPWIEGDSLFWWENAPIVDEII